MNPRVNKWLDLLDRVGWTAIQAAAAALVAYLATDDFGWEEGLVFVGWRRCCCAEGRDRPEHRWRRLGCADRSACIEPAPK